MVGAAHASLGREVLNPAGWCALFGETEAGGSMSKEKNDIARTGEVLTLHPAHQNLFVIEHAKAIHLGLLAHGVPGTAVVTQRLAEAALVEAEALLAELVKRGRL